MMILLQMPYKDKQKQKEASRNHYLKNKEVVIERKQKHIEEAQKSALESLTHKVILDERCWKLWFNERSYKPCSVSTEDAFNIMIQGCFYCGDFAMTLDRLDSTLEHTLENCVGCCEFCNRSKAACDPMSFILRAVYRRIFVYYEDDDIWNDNIRMPLFSTYEKNVQQQNRPFELTKEQFKELCTSACWYCKRHPPFVGIDKICPDDGYVTSNCVPCCQSCNRDKWDVSLEDFTLRDERITQRYITGYFDNMSNISKNNSHFKLNTRKKSVFQYTIDGTFIKSYESSKKAEKDTKINAGNICTCARGDLQTAGGFVWSYEKRA